MRSKIQGNWDRVETVGRHGILFGCQQDRVKLGSKTRNMKPRRTSSREVRNLLLHEFETKRVLLPMEIVDLPGLGDIVSTSSNSAAVDTAICMHTNRMDEACVDEKVRKRFGTGIQ
jgi:hypothetical protein